MSHIATGIVQRRRAGGPTNKAVLMFMAACASDDGTGIWTSKGNMAADLEMSKRTVQRSIEALLGAGLISEIGQRQCRNGFTVEYRINLETIEKLALTRVTLSPVDTTSRGDTVTPVTQHHRTGDTVTPQGVTECHPNLPRTFLEPCVSPKAPHTQDVENDHGKPCLNSGHGRAQDANACSARDETRVPSSDTAFDFNAFLSAFTKAYPRIGDSDATEAELRKAIERGADPAHILNAAKAYADEQKGNKRQYVAYSENWLRQKRWEQFAKPGKGYADHEAIMQFRANEIREGKEWIARYISAAAARELVARALVTEEQCRAVGVTL